MNPFLDLLLFLATLIYSYLEAFVKLFVPVKRKSVSGELVLITGAGHGVGRATAFEFAKRRSRLVLWDINKHGVEETAAECERLGATVQAFVVDCSKREEIYSAVKKDIGDVSILVNNAGVITAADLLSTQDHQIERMFEVNILAHIWTTRAFLPTMMNNNHGHIVTVASAAGHFVTSFMVQAQSNQNVVVSAQPVAKHHAAPQNTKRKARGSGQGRGGIIHHLWSWAQDRLNLGKKQNQFNLLPIKSKQGY
uniref:Estradiol 17-beta-dehydrogenase 11 n=1 Tax=Accipiter nisus TaxID=211598 RepID=A0A8B9LWI8_9AVES